MITELTLNSDQLDELPQSVLIALLGDLHDRSHDNGSDASHTATWLDAADREWDFPCYILQVGVRAVVWSDTDEARVADISVVDAEDDLQEQIREYADDLAGDLGTLAGHSRAQ